MTHLNILIILHNYLSINSYHFFEKILDVASFLRESGATLNFASKRADEIAQSAALAVKEEERVSTKYFILLILLS